MITNAKDIQLLNLTCAMESTATLKQQPLLQYYTGQEKLLQHYSKQAQWHYEQSLMFAQYAWSVNEKLIALRTQRKEPCYCETKASGEAADDFCCLNDVVAEKSSSACHDKLNNVKGTLSPSYCNNPMCVCENNNLQKDGCMDVDANTGGVTLSAATTNNNIDTTTVNLSSKKKKKKKKRRCKSNVMRNPDESEMATEEGNMEVDPAFREFLRQSAKFRMERDAAKKVSAVSNTNNDNDGMVDAEAEECVEYVDVMCKGPEGTILPPTARNREALYYERYGSRGTALLSMETAVQWQFNKFCDAMRPKPWPSIPLNM